MSTPQLSGSAKSIKVLGPDGAAETIRYAPLTYRHRGELDLLFQDSGCALPPSKNLERLLEQVPESEAEYRFGGEEGIEKMRRNARQADAVWEASAEADEARALFVSNFGRLPDDRRDYRAAFLAVVMQPHCQDMDESRAVHYVNMLTKGQLVDIYEYALEVGPYAPK